MGDERDRKNATTDIPTLWVAMPPEIKREMSAEIERELLLKLYEQTCTTWRGLVDVRFKLLALVPTASLVALATLVSTSDPAKFLGSRLLLSVLGLVTTLGLLVYELRNTELHNDLISRGRKIEEELGIHAGVFLNRLEPNMAPKGLIRHSTATWMICGAAIVAWFAAIWTSAPGEVATFLHQLWSCFFVHNDAP